jgi:preprotein translocase subunit SecD
MRRRQKASLVLFVAVALGSLLLTLVAGNSPQLGLDLQGGVSVVYSPRDEVDSETLDQVISIIRNRVDALGVAEPEISRQGGNILVQLPGVQDQQRALSIIGTTAELRFRPVVRELPAEGVTLESLGLDPNATTTTAAPPTTAEGSAELPATTTTVPRTAEERRQELEDLVGLSVPTTPPEDDRADEVVVLPEYDRRTGEMTRRWELGPAQLTGSALTDAQARYSTAQGWNVEVEFRGGDDGTNQLNALASACRAGTEQCPAQRMGITLDGRVEFAGGIQSDANPPFPDGRVVITGGYDQRAARDIALALRYGALPVQLVPETAQTVSASIGNDAKNAGIAAGIIGVLLVSAYILYYYRLLGAVALGSLLLSTSLLWTIVSYLGETRGLTLTLAGITGLIVSLGVSLDSNIVYFENMKEDIRNGRTPRSATERSFVSAFSTIVKADIAALIGAAALYFLTVGAVRGFAFYLGLAVVLDLAATYFFLGPAVQLIGRRAAFTRRPSRYGLPSKPAADSILPEVAH